MGNVALFGSHHFSTIHLVLVVIHVCSAILSLVMAPLSLAVTKGGAAHRMWGKVYFWGMFVANASAVVLLFYRFNIFLLGVTILSFYSAFSGYRVLYRKRPAKGNGPQLLDWSGAVVALVMGVALIGWGGIAFFTGRAIGMPLGPDESVPLFIIILPLIFGFFVGQSAVTDIRLFRRPKIDDRNWWWYYHMDRMLGSYIGLTTALMVQQVGPRMPESIAWVVWIAPSIIGAPLIARWIGSYRRKFNAAKTATSVTAA